MNSNWIFPSFTILNIFSLFYRFSNELMQAAGKSVGKCSSWSSIRETKGLMTIDTPFKTIDESKYVKDFPDAVSDTKRVDFPDKMLKMVSY